MEGSLSGVVGRNIRALLEVRAQNQRRRTRSEKIADAITHFTGSMPFVVLHAVVFGAWIFFNTSISPIRPFDPFPFVMLAMIASVEAIFLSTFVLISQNRSAAVSEQRAELDLQINLLAEHEVTRLLALSEAIARKLDIEVSEDLADLKRDVEPKELLETIERSQPEDER